MTNIIIFPQRTPVPETQILYHAQAQAQYVPERGLCMVQDWHVVMPKNNS